MKSFTKIIKDLLPYCALLAVNLHPAVYDIPRAPFRVISADITYDGYDDIIIGHRLFGGWKGITILGNQGDGTFETLSSIYYSGVPSNLELGFIDDNDNLDLVTEYIINDNQERGVAILFDYNAFTGPDSVTMIESDQIYINSIKIADMDIDSNNDIIYTRNVLWSGDDWGVIYNNGEGVFSEPEFFPVDYARSIECVDYNEDGRPDVFINFLGNIYVWENTELGFQQTIIVDNAMAYLMELSDVDHDTDFDIIFSHGLYPYLRIKYNDGNGNFSDEYITNFPDLTTPVEIQAYNLNNDYYPDIVWTNDTYYTHILFNDQDGTFSEVDDFYTGPCSWNSSSADYDKNCWNDISVIGFLCGTYDTGYVHILYNDGNEGFVEDPLPPAFFGDIDQDDQLTVADILMIVEIILSETNPAPFTSCLSDINWDIKTNIVDIVMIVGIILSD